MGNPLTSKRAGAPTGSCMVISALIHLAIVAQLPHFTEQVRKPRANQAVSVDLVTLDQVSELVKVRPSFGPSVPDRTPRPAPLPDFSPAAAAATELAPRPGVAGAVTAKMTPAAPSTAARVPAPEPLTPPGGAAADPLAVTQQPKEEPGGRVTTVPAQGGDRRPVAQEREDDRGARRLEYLRRSRLLIERHKQYPLMAIQRRSQGTVLVGASVQRDGTLRHCEILQSSGSLLLDNAALRSLRAVAKFPAIPVELHTDVMDFQVPVSFSLSRQ